MDAQEAEAAYRTLKNQLDSGQIQMDVYYQKIAELRYQDNIGTWWAINGTDGSWLKWTGSTWEPAFAQQASVQQTPPQVTVTPTVTTPTPVAKERKKRNWVGIGSLVFGILAWIIFPYVCGVLALCIGIFSLYITRKTTGKIAFVAIAGIVIAVASIILNFFYLTLFAPHILPSLK